MMNISTATLGKICLGTALAGSGIAYVTRWTIQSRIRDSASYQEAMEFLRNHKNAVDILGEPIKDKRVNIGDNNCYGNKDNVAWITVPLEGRKTNGNLHYWITVTDASKNEFHISKIELGLGESSKTKILLKNYKSDEQTTKATTKI